MYIQGFDGAKELREQLMQVESVDELLHRLETATQAIKNPTA
jgi:tRNA-dihydrouridine synthase